MKYLVSCLGLFTMLSYGCGSHVDEVCEDLERDKCSSDISCGSQDPCSFKCGILQYEDEAAFETCAGEFLAIDIPDELAHPIYHYAGCAQKSAKFLHCLTYLTP
jgi:hypothetical protein